MVIHVFNSTVVSGPETLVIPALSGLGMYAVVVILCERRKAEGSGACLEFARSFGLDVREVWVDSRFDRKAIGELGGIFVSLGASVVHAHDFKASVYALIASFFAKRKTRRKLHLISTHHGVRGRSGILARLYEKLYSHLVLRWFDRVLTVCSSDYRLLIRRGLDPRRVRVHLNGVDRKCVPPQSRREVRERIRREWRIEDYGLRKDAVLIGYVGRIAAEKGIGRILKVAAALDRSHCELPHWALLVFGKGPLEKKLARFTYLLGLGHRVAWMGYRAGLGDELAGFDLVISMSRAEGLPINLIESGWGATPVVATRVDGNLDLIPENRLGILVDDKEADEAIADRIAAVISDAAARERMGYAFQEHVKEYFSGQRWLKELSAIYGDLGRNGEQA